MPEESLSARILRLAQSRTSKRLARPVRFRAKTGPIFASDVAIEELRIWRGMISRCHRPNYNSYLYYGAIGVSVCWPWYCDFEIFLSDVGPRPSPEHSIDRYPNPAGNYEPGNVRWATPQQQYANKRPRPHYYSRESMRQRLARIRAEKEWLERLEASRTPLPEYDWDAICKIVVDKTTPSP